ncbi:F-box/WD repeat-containing protein 7-like [Haliotis asinina]|uniref:F-box/WD repeat-containing protein 7-like n=1 Tax=Haliotis asinina TaxID=109174 RepID=UPI003531E6DD
MEGSRAERETPHAPCQDPVSCDPDLDTAVNLLQLRDSDFLKVALQNVNNHVPINHHLPINSHVPINRLRWLEFDNAGNKKNLCLDAGNLGAVEGPAIQDQTGSDVTERNNNHVCVEELVEIVDKTSIFCGELMKEGNAKRLEHRITIEEPISGQQSKIGIHIVNFDSSNGNVTKQPLARKQLSRSNSVKLSCPDASYTKSFIKSLRSDESVDRCKLKSPVAEPSSSIRVLHLEDSGLPSSPCYSGSDCDVTEQGSGEGGDSTPKVSCMRYLSDPSPLREWSPAMIGRTSSSLSEGLQDMSLSTSPSSDEATCSQDKHLYMHQSNPDSDDPRSPPPQRMMLFQTANSFCYGENDPPPEISYPPKCSSFPLRSDLDLCESVSQASQYYPNIVNGNDSYTQNQYKNIAHQFLLCPLDTEHNEAHQPTSVQCWGHFSRPRRHYKYRRSDYSSESEDDVPVRSSAPPCRVSARSQKSHLAIGNLQRSLSLGTGSKSGVPDDIDCTDGLDFREGVKPCVFKEKLATMKRWFADFSDEQKNIVLKSLLSGCDLPQIHLLSVKMEANLHRGCPPNCQDIITWLPSYLAAKIMSYLDPVSLCRSSQVCKVWQQLADDPSFWRRFCCQPKWRLSKAAEHKQVISHMSVEGSIQWKNVFAERFRLRNNWLRGRCTVRTFEGHTQGISCVQFDDTRIVSGSSDKTVKVWNIRTNAPWSVQTLVGHSGTVRCLHLEGSRLVSGSSDKTIKVWDLSTRDSWSSIACKVTMIGHTDTVRCLQVDDDKVISGSYDKTLKVWDLKTGNCRRTLRGHNAAVLCVHFNESKIVSGSCDNTIKVWNYQGLCMITLSGHHDAVTCLQFDATRIVSGSLDCNLKFWDIHSGECINTIDWKAAEGHTGVVRCLQADSWRLVSAADDKTIKVWNLETGQRLVTLQNHKDGVTCLQFNDFIIVSGSYDKTVKLWDFSCC